MSVHKRKETGSWFVRFRDEFGQQHNKTFGPGPENKRQAEAFDLLVKAKKRARDPLFQSKSGNAYLDELAQAWVNAKKTEGKGGGWLKDWVGIMNNHLLPTLGTVPINELTKDFILNVVMKKWGNRAPTTRNRYLSYLKVMFNWGIENDYNKINPLAKWKKTKERPRQSTLTREELGKIRAVAMPHIQFAIDLAYNLGVRTGPSELLSLRWRDIDWDNQIIRVFATKTNKWRMIPITPEFLERLREAQKSAQTEFLVEYKGKPIKSLKNGFRGACERAGIDSTVISYDVRHLFCSTLLYQGSDPVAVSQLMGHASTRMTLDQYGHALAGSKRRAVERLPRLGE